MSDYSSVAGIGSVKNGITVETPYEDGNKSVSIDEFLKLMIAEMTNQNVFDSGSGGGGSSSGDYITQLAQITTMQQMQELAYYSKSNYVMGLIGKDVTVATLGVGGSVTKDTGAVEKIVLEGKDYTVYVNGKGYSLKEIMSINTPGVVDSTQIVDTSKISPIIDYTKDTSAKMHWDPASNQKDVLDKMTYSVYYSKDENFDSLEQVKKGTLAGTTKDGTETDMLIKDLDPDTTYYVNIVITLPNGKQQLYRKTNFTTKE